LYKLKKNYFRVAEESFEKYLKEIHSSEAKEKSVLSKLLASKKLSKDDVQTLIFDLILAGVDTVKLL